MLAVNSYAEKVNSYSGGRFGGEIAEGERSSPVSPARHAWVCCRGGELRGLLLRGEMGGFPPPSSLTSPYSLCAMQHGNKDGGINRQRKELCWLLLAIIVLVS